MKIEFSIDRLDCFLPQIASQLGLPMTNNGFELPPNQGEGHFCQVQINEAILISYYDLLLHEATSIIRKKSNNDSVIPIIFWLSHKGIKQELESEKKEIGKSTPNGIFLPSNSIETKYTFPSGMPVKNITVFVKKDWLKANIVGQNDYLNNVILSSHKYFLFEEINYKINDLLMQMEHTLKHEMNKSLSKIKLHADTLRLLHLFFEKITTRALDKHLVKINPQDIERLFSVKAILMQNYISIPSTMSLAKECGINERKLQRLFKQVFGKSIYQFAMAIKMAEAKKMLATKKYAVSEVGYAMGYSNLSHFTEKFKAYHRITPKSFLLSI